MPAIGDNDAVRPARAFVTFVLLFAGLLGILAVIERAGAPLPVAEIVLAVLAFLAFPAAGLMTRTLLFSRFALADRRLAAGWSGMALAGSLLSGLVPLALTGPGLGLGREGLALLLAPLAGIAVMALVIAPPLRRSQAVTAADYLAGRGGRIAAFFGALILFAAGEALLIAEFGVIARLAPRYLHVSAETASWLAALAILAALVLGGLRGMTVAQVASFMVAGAALVVPAVLALSSTNAFVATLPSLAQALSAVSPGDLFVRPGLDRANFLALLLGLAMGFAALPSMIVRVAAAPDPGSARRALAIGFLALGVLFVAVPVHAIFGQFLALADRTPGAMTGRMTPVLDALFGAGVIAAALGSAAALAHGLAAMLVNDLYGAALDPMASPGRRLVLFRLGLVVCAVFAAFQALRAGDLFRLAASGLALGAGVIFPALIVARWRAIGRITMLAGMAVGFSVTLLALAAGWVFTDFGLERLGMIPVSASSPGLGVGWFGISAHAAGAWGAAASFAAMLLAFGAESWMKRPAEKAEATDSA